MSDLDPLFSRLARSTFRSRFRLGNKERQYCWDKGPDTIDQHAADFDKKRLAPAQPAQQQHYIVSVFHHWLVIQLNSQI